MIEATLSPKYQLTRNERVIYSTLNDLYGVWVEELANVEKTFITRNYVAYMGANNSQLGFIYAGKSYRDKDHLRKKGAISFLHEKLIDGFEAHLKRESYITNEMRQIHGYLSRILMVGNNVEERAKMIPDNLKTHWPGITEPLDTDNHKPELALAPFEIDKFIEQNVRYSDLIFSRLTKNLLRK